MGITVRSIATFTYTLAGFDVFLGQLRDKLSVIFPSPVVNELIVEMNRQ